MTPVLEEIRSQGPVVELPPLGSLGTVVFLELHISGQDILAPSGERPVEVSHLPIKLMNRRMVAQPFPVRRVGNDDPVDLIGPPILDGQLLERDVMGQPSRAAVLVSDVDHVLVDIVAVDLQFNIVVRLSIRLVADLVRQAIQGQVDPLFTDEGAVDPRRNVVSI